MSEYESVSSGGRANLADAIRAHAKDRPGAVALVGLTGDGVRDELNWAAFDRAVDESANALAALGLVAGQRVMVLSANNIEAAVAYFGALRAGLIAVPTNPGVTDEELRRIAEHCGARVLLSDEPRAQVSGVVTEMLSDYRRHAGQGSPVSPPDPETVAAIVYTAGSSGVPKGSMLTHRALVAYCEASEQVGLADRNATILCLLPIFHVYGLNAVLGAGVHLGATTVLVDGYPEQLCEMIVSERVSHLPLTPSALYRLANDPGLPEALAHLKFVSSGAAPLPGALGEQFRRITGLRVEQGFGLTEAAPGVATTFGHEILGPGHVGRAFPCVELRIGDGAHPSEPGEIMIRGANLFSGYWPAGEGAPDADGWFATGDIGYLQGEDLFVVDRARELIIVSGFNVYPSEIEEILEEHEDVETAAVIGQPDELTGERVVAFVTGKRVNIASVQAHAASRLARYKVPAEFLVLRAMPRAATGKIRKGILRDILDSTEEGDA